MIDITPNISLRELKFFLYISKNKNRFTDSKAIKIPIIDFFSIKLVGKAAKVINNSNKAIKLKIANVLFFLKTLPLLYKEKSVVASVVRTKNKPMIVINKNTINSPLN